MNLSNDEKLMLTMILDQAELATRKEREVYLRSADSDAQAGVIKGLTTKLQFIEKLQSHCMQMAAT